MKGKKFTVLPDVQLGRELFAINFYDPWWLTLWGIPQKEAVVGEAITERLKRAVEWMNLQPPIEFVVSIGDLTDSGTPEQLARVNEICGKLNKPFIPLIGNHDVWPYRRQQGKKKVIWEAERPLTVGEFEFYFREWRNSSCFENFEVQDGWLQNYAFVTKGVRFVIVDNNNRRKAPLGLPGQAGWAKLYPESRQWVEKQISSSKEKRIIIFSHAPLRTKWLKALEKEKEILNIAGHTHKRSVKQEGNVIVLTVNALYHEPLVLMVEVSENSVKTEYQRI